MEVIQFVREGLGNNSYLVEIGEGGAALIDPDRSVGRYLETAKSRGWNITAIFETHIHADFVSGVLEAAYHTGADLLLPEASGADFPHQTLRLSHPLKFSGTTVQAVASPGHTPEHMSYVLDTLGEAPALFSGGSLIVGGAARTDLISEGMTESLTRAQYRTIRSAFSGLPDETLLYPTHGAGSF